jgi:hypothetical protein
VIHQVTEPVQFTEPSSRLVVPLADATVPGTVLVAAFTIAGAGTRTPAITVEDDLGMAPSRWRLANDSNTPAGRRAFWVRIGSHPGVTQVIATTANDLPVKGSGVVLEASGMSAGDATQVLADLLAGGVE